MRTAIQDKANRDADFNRDRTHRTGLPEDIESVLAVYTVRNQGRVRAYIADNPDIISTLLAAPKRLEAVFGANVVLTIDIAADPEGTQDISELWILAGCGEDVDSALFKLRTLDRQWTAYLPWPLRGKVNIDVEFV